jgi:pectate lyase
MNKLHASITGTIIAFSAMGIFASPNFNMIGYATVSGGTTGGAGGSTTTISTIDQLVTWGASREKNTTPEIVQISGKITGGSTTLITIKNGANITITGVGTTAELSGVGLNIRDYTNVIVKNLKIHEIPYPDDALTLDNVQHGWVDHCELYSKIGAGITQDTYDGLLDIKKGSAFITISWCRLHDHMKCSLIGHTDNTGQQAEDSQIRVTYHHDWFYSTDGRNPSLRFGAVHMFNNIYENITDYGLAARDGGHAKVENCHYNNVVLPMSTDKFPVDGLPNGYICQTGNTFTGTCGANVISQTGCDFWNSTTLPYSYSLDPVSSLETIVKPNSGIPGSPIPVSIYDGGYSAPSPSALAAGNAVGMRMKVVLSGKNVRAHGDVYDIYGRKIPSSALRVEAIAPKVYVVKAQEKSAESR